MKERLGKAKVEPITHTKGGTHYRDAKGKTITEQEFKALKDTNKKETK